MTGVIVKWRGDANGDRLVWHPRFIVATDFPWPSATLGRRGSKSPRRWKWNQWKLDQNASESKKSNINEMNILIYNKCTVYIYNSNVNEIWICHEHCNHDNDQDDHDSGCCWKNYVVVELLMCIESSNDMTEVLLWSPYCFTSVTNG